MRRVAEIIYVVESEREEFIKGATNPDIETQKVLWMCGVRKQQYFALRDLIFMTFEYEGNSFNEDMAKMSAYLDSKDLLIKTRRRDVPIEDLNNVNWWAPVKRIGTTLDTNPFANEVQDVNLMAMLDGSMNENDNWDTSFSEEDWMEDFHF